VQEVQFPSPARYLWCSMVQCVAVCCSVLQCVAVCCCVLQCVVMSVCAISAVWCSVLQCVAVCCSVLQCVAVCCCMLQCVAVCCTVCLCNMCSPSPELTIRNVGNVHKIPSSLLGVCICMCVYIVHVCVQLQYACYHTCMGAYDLHLQCTGWPSCKGCLIFTGLRLQKSPIISGTFLWKEIYDLRHPMHLRHLLHVSMKLQHA